MKSAQIGAMALAVIGLAVVSGCSATVGVPSGFIPKDAKAECEGQCRLIGMSLGAVAIMAGNVGCVCQASTGPATPVAVMGGMAAIDGQRRAAVNQSRK